MRVVQGFASFRRALPGKIWPKVSSSVEDLGQLEHRRGFARFRRGQGFEPFRDLSRICAVSSFDRDCGHFGPSRAVPRNWAVSSFADRG